MTNPEDLDSIWKELLKTYWANKRTLEQTKKSLENSLCFYLYYKKTWIGLIRVITDYVTYAYLCDVILKEQYRHQGVGTWFLGAVLSDDRLKDIQRFALYTRDAQEFYRKFGFHEMENPKLHMVKTDKENM